MASVRRRVNLPEERAMDDLTCEYCERCKASTGTQLPPMWARRSSVVLLLTTCSLPFLAPFLASDPVVTVVAFLGLGLSAGPMTMIMRSPGSCAECSLKRGGMAFSRLGLRRFLGSAAGS
ncbi:MAG: hypothetical protein RL385_3036 [Pseudomonadota bacterium]